MNVLQLDHKQVLSMLPDRDPYSHKGNFGKLLLLCGSKGYTGAAEMAICTGAEIVPIAFEKFGKNFYVNIGANISPKNFVLEQKQELTDMLRDRLATLKWELWEMRFLIHWIN